MKPESEYPESERITNEIHAHQKRMGAEARKAEARRMNKVDANAYSDLVGEVLAARYHPDTFEKLKLEAGLAARNNIYTQIIHMADVSWSEGARYWLAGEKGEEIDSDQFRAVINAMRPDELMRDLSHRSAPWGHRALCAMPVLTYDEQAAKLRLKIRVFTPEHFDQVPCSDDRSQLEVLAIYDTDEEGQTIKHMWSALEYVCFRFVRGQWEEVKDSRYDHGYGRIPAVIVKPNGDELWANTDGPRLAEAAIEHSAADVLFKYMMSGQAKVLAANSATFPSGQYVRHAGAIDTGGGVPAILDFTTDVAGFRAAFLDGPRRDACASMDLPPDALEAGGPESGEALKMRMHRRDRTAIARRVWLRAALVELYWVTVLVLWRELYEQANGNSPPCPIDGFDGGFRSYDENGALVPFTPVSPEAVLPPYQAATHIHLQPVKFGCDVRDVTYPELMTERQAREEYELRMGYTSRAEYMVAQNPELTIDESLLAIKNNLALEAAFTQKIKAAPLPMKPGEKPTAEPADPIKAVEDNTEKILQQLSLTMQRLKPVGDAKPTPDETRVLKATAAKLLAMIKNLDVT